MIAAIYACKSTDQNGVSDEEKAVTRQIEHAKAYAVKKGWSVADDYVYVYEGLSGAERTTVSLRRVVPRGRAAAGTGA